MLAMLGPGCFGAVIGWIVYRTLRRSSENVKLADISAVIGAVGGGAVIAIFNKQELFASYSIGLAVGFFLYLVVAFIVGGKTEANKWLGD